MFNGPKLIITYYFYLCIVALVSWAEMFNLAGLEFCISAALENNLEAEFPALHLAHSRLSRIAPIRMHPTISQMFTECH